MKTMCKEEIAQKKLPVVLCSFFLLVIAISISGFIDRSNPSNRVIQLVVDSMLAILLTSFIGSEIIRCRIKYRYSIIADQLIIHKIAANESKLVENIKIKDIKLLNKSSNLRSIFGFNNQYTCSMIGNWTYCCIYFDGHKTKKFYFKPSRSFILKLEKLMKAEKLAG